MKKLFLVLLAIALAFSFGLVACGGGEEEEEEEEEPCEWFGEDGILRHEVFLNKIIFSDGEKPLEDWGWEAELSVYWRVTHSLPCRPTRTKEGIIEADVDDAARTWILNKNIYKRDECNPKGKMELTFKVWERDAWFPVGLVRGLLSAVSVWELLKDKSQLGQLNVLVAQQGQLEKIWDKLKGVQWYGQTVIIANEGKDQSTGNITGEAGKSNIFYDYTTTLVQEYDCCPCYQASESTYDTGDLIAVQTAFTNWRDALTMANQIEAEPGSNLTPEDIDYDREVLRNGIVDIVDSVVEAFIASIESEADPYSEALQYLSGARDLRHISLDEAMDPYESAALATIDTLIDLYPKPPPA